MLFEALALPGFQPSDESAKLFNLRLLRVSREVPEEVQVVEALLASLKLHRKL